MAGFPTPTSTSTSTSASIPAASLDPYLSVDSGGKSTPILTPSQSSNGQPDTDSNPEIDDDWNPSPATSNPGGYVGPARPAELDRHERDTAIDDDDDDDDEQPANHRSVLKQDFTEMSTWAGLPHIKGSSEAMRMVLLTFNAIGITFIWGVEMTYCTLYLLNLGLTKSNTSLVWIAGPLSGLIVQPIFLLYTEPIHKIGPPGNRFGYADDCGTLCVGKTIKDTAKAAQSLLTATLA